MHNIRVEKPRYLFVSAAEMAPTINISAEGAREDVAFSQHTLFCLTAAAALVPYNDKGRSNRLVCGHCAYLSGRRGR